MPQGTGPARPGRAIEASFPIGFVSQVAEHESWRKEIYRPVYYIHKWWARRLGSVFRAILLASCVDVTEDVAGLFYQRVSLPEVVVFDPFMGSGTTVGEAVKLGCRVIGRDINPVSFTMVTAALRDYSETEVKAQYRRLEATAGAAIRPLYGTTLGNGHTAEVLYYFWVKVVPCPACGREIELFRSRIFARHALSGSHPEAKAVCPHCRAINDVLCGDQQAVCSACGTRYDPRLGAVRGSKVFCADCGAAFTPLAAVRRLESPPEHRMYAKMVLCENGEKRYLPIDQADSSLYQRAADMLPGLWEFVPKEEILAGHNTRQVLNYNYRYWHQMFNARQLVSLALLVSEISRIPDTGLRTLFACLLSGTLEFNNMFASFKGEGTGAVRHMFAHHILKPELAPIEANVWGTLKSSGSFSTLFKTRVMRALEYKARPSELSLAPVAGARKARQIAGISRPINERPVFDYRSFADGGRVYLSVGDSSCTDMPDGCVDLVITDPPFFDNVHYSELADFFHVWLRRMLPESEATRQATTRSPQEVQNGDAAEFAARLAAVLKECHRVLKPDGLLVFTYHHSRIEGWLSLYQAVRQAGFSITAAHPVKSEMAVSVPINQASDPINYDLIIVCRKRPQSLPAACQGVSLDGCLKPTRDTVAELRAAGLRVSQGDIRVILMGSVLPDLSMMGDLDREFAQLRELGSRLDAVAARLAETDGADALRTAGPHSPQPVGHDQPVQLTLLDV